jgi:hypothetical protein
MPNKKNDHRLMRPFTLRKSTSKSKHLRLRSHPRYCPRSLLGCCSCRLGCRLAVGLAIGLAIILAVVFAVVRVRNAFAAAFVERGHMFWPIHFHGVESLRWTPLSLGSHWEDVISVALSFLFAFGLVRWAIIFFVRWAILALFVVFVFLFFVFVGILAFLTLLAVVAVVWPSSWPSCGSGTFSLSSAAASAMCSWPYTVMGSNG